MEQKMIGEWTAEWAKKNKFSFKYFETIESTNSFAKSLPDEEHFDLIIADTQTKGRGRGQNTWLNTNPGAQLLSSWVYQVDRPPQPIISPLVGLHVFQALKSKWPDLIWSVKAPNDIFINNKKVAGILIETVTVKKRHRVIVGIGINVKGFPDLPQAGDLESQLPEPITREAWSIFLNRLNLGIHEGVSSGLQGKINPLNAVELLQALNLNPYVKIPYIKVLSDGSLRTAEGIVPWTQI